MSPEPVRPYARLRPGWRGASERPATAPPSSSASASSRSRRVIWATSCGSGWAASTARGRPGPGRPPHPDARGDATASGGPLTPDPFPLRVAAIDPGSEEARLVWMRHRDGVARLLLSVLRGWSDRLFDQLMELHGLGAADRRILVGAAVLHDVGQFISFRKHEKHSLSLINNVPYQQVGASRVPEGEDPPRRARGPLPQTGTTDGRNRRRTTTSTMSSRRASRSGSHASARSSGWPTRSTASTVSASGSSGSRRSWPTPGRARWYSRWRAGGTPPRAVGDEEEDADVRIRVRRNGAPHHPRAFPRTRSHTMNQKARR